MGRCRTNNAASPLWRLPQELPHVPTKWPYQITEMGIQRCNLRFEIDVDPHSPSVKRYAYFRLRTKYFLSTSSTGNAEMFHRYRER
ncbi:hypothetical protein DOTSEDRAFT_75269 [Dothistroma septosporum NZE10]|uniref:Uncharacterized protein n=1 Tax=Dothistroma septosporum (strain NZE10 / CBS 128990) TaxID=675120 RepID=M2YL01_DOTSN|nr:hypothetical protein DOTSEDRAFT_75269 [Dothistroma septosporum NZE10]